MLQRSRRAGPSRSAECKQAARFTQAARVAQGACVAQTAYLAQTACIAMCAAAIAFVPLPAQSAGYVAPADEPLSATGRNKEIIRYPAQFRARSRIETVIDKGLTMELIVQCPTGTGVLNVVKHEKLYCGPDHFCTHIFSDALARLCR